MRDPKVDPKEGDRLGRGRSVRTIVRWFPGSSVAYSLKSRPNGLVIEREFEFFKWAATAEVLHTAEEKAQ